MKLYYAPGTCAVACWIALEWAGADYEVEKLSLIHISEPTRPCGTSRMPSSA